MFYLWVLYLNLLHYANNSLLLRGLGRQDLDGQGFCNDGHNPEVKNFYILKYISAYTQTMAFYHASNGVLMCKA